MRAGRRHGLFSTQSDFASRGLVAFDFFIVLHVANLQNEMLAGQMKLGARQERRARLAHSSVLENTHTHTARQTDSPGSLDEDRRGWLCVGSRGRADELINNW